MAQIQLPYGKTHLSVNVPEKNLIGVFESELPAAADDQSAEVTRALDNPIGTMPLEELAKGKGSAVIITSDHTRPVPSKIIMPEILKRLRKGSPDIRITILVATGFHRATTRDELVAKLGIEIVDKEQIVIHDSGDASMLTHVGTLPSGGDLILNKLAMETELLVAEGFIEPHFFAGFSGGRKSVLPGVASRETVLANHCSEFIQSPYARTGILENNPIHRDMLFAAEQANLQFIVNVVINSEKKIVKCFAGNPVQAHLTGCNFLRSLCQVKVPQADIVITSNGGYPLDQNVYQSVKGMTAGEAVCRKHGVIIMTASCSDGHGGESFFRNLSEAASPAALLEQTAAIPRDKTVPDQWEYQILARILNDHTVIMVTTDCCHEMLNRMHLHTASTLPEALEAAFGIMGSEASVAVIPDGVSVIAVKQ
jgi:nickel-dependent lactate racemase